MSEQGEPQAQETTTTSQQIPQTENLPALDKKEIRVNVTDNTKRVMYLIILKETYGMLEAFLLWYRNFRKDLESEGFKCNVYDACVANISIKN